MRLWIVILGVAVFALGPARVSAQDHSPEPGYQDERSTPEAVIGSFYDAVNRREYARAYSYWEPSAAESELPAFDDFAQGYADTSSVDVTMGDVGSGVGAGQLYFSVPVILVATHVDASVQTYVGCYTLPLARPQIQAVPPFRPLAIERANMMQVDNDADTQTLMGQACAAV